ncbi:MAG: Gx transporter family protein [Firmicutes bacterium]|nr:Gx transporter family protein [Bacillota bacterium]MBQ6260674.1 Gx transporter family protein [Bacillota bacterium]
MNAKRITTMGLLTAVALIIFVIEAQIPPLVPVPGVKLGLANIITVYAMFALGPRDTFMILMVRILLGSVFAGSLMSMLFSLGGGICCFLVMLLLRRILSQDQIWICSVIGAMAHGIGQMAVTVAVYRTGQLLIYLPVLMLSGMIAGAFTGMCAQLVVKRMKSIK